MFLCVKVLRRSAYYLGALAICCMLSLSACSDDDDDDNQDNPSGQFEGSLEDAKYQADAVKYTVNGNSEIGSIELTSSGNYLILPTKTNLNFKALSPASGKTTQVISFFGKRAKLNTRAGGSSYFGTFTKNTDGSYQLKGYATLRIMGEEQIKLETESSSITLNVKKETVKAENNKLNNRLCRSWHPVSATLTAYTNGKVVATQTLNTAEDLKSEFYDYIVISPFGTFLQVDYGNIVDDSGVWSWTNTEQQIFKYSLPEGNGSVQVSFSDDVAWFNDEYTDVSEEDGQPITIKVNIKCKAC